MQAATRNTTMKSDNICVTSQQLYSVEPANKTRTKEKDKIDKKKQQNRKL